VCTFHEVLDPPAADDPPIPIGRPCANTRCLVEDDAGNVVSAPGVEGELVVQDSIVAQRYWGNPARTAQGFPAPYTYWTGDVVHWSDGPHGRVLRFVGRRDHMVKSRGYRIELGEIETALYAQVDVEEAAAVAVPDELLGSRILAFCAAPAALDEEKLKRLCRQRLPQYMVPERIVLLERLPRAPKRQGGSDPTARGGRTASPLIDEVCMMVNVPQIDRRATVRELLAEVVGS
jgi:acyl carrier protein